MTRTAQTGAGSGGRLVGGWTAAMPPITVLLLLGPVVLGLVGIAALASGVVGPAAGPAAVFGRVAAVPGLATAAGLTMVIALAATLGSLLAALAILALLPRRAVRWAAALAAPLVALPPATIAIGLAFLLTGSGWLARLVSPWATGWDRPPPFGLDGEAAGLILALMVKETPFLLLAALVALPRLDADRRRALAATLGYAPVTAWVKTVLPSLMGSLRLPIWAAMAFAAGQVDMALLIGPDLPPPLAVTIWREALAPDPMAPAVAAGGAILLLGVTAAAIGMWEAGLWLVGRIGARWLTAGARGDRFGRVGPLAGRLTGTVALLPLLLGWLAVAGLAIWSWAGSWRFPAALPTGWAATAWQRAAADLTGTLGLTLALAAAVALVAAVLAIGCLEAEDRRARRPGQGHLWVLYAPLLVPQISFLFGATAGLVAVNGDGTLAAVAWFHLTFVLPYVWLVLAGPWRSLDPRWSRAAGTLGRGPDATLLRVKLPLISPAFALAIGLGMVISVSLYLPTQFAGAGRVATLATETVGIALGADRRTGAVYALALGLPAVACLAVAVALPGLLWRHRRGMRAA